MQRKGALALIIQPLGLLDGTRPFGRVLLHTDMASDAHERAPRTRLLNTKRPQLIKPGRIALLQ
eukprot:15437401-Alexandrium_andersonii.AAC.1